MPASTLIDPTVPPTRTPVSFELFPPRTSAAEARLRTTIPALAAADPAFISVTYGAAGSSRGATLDIVRRVIRDAHVPPLAHLTCVGLTADQAAHLVRRFLDAGVRHFLALRGDPPSDGRPHSIDPSVGLGSAAELVQLIHRVQAERAQFDDALLPAEGSARFASPAARVADERDGSGPRLRQPGRRVEIAVAAFPNGHPRSRDLAQDLDTLLAKEAAGATLAITQLFYRADDYLTFVDRARSAGVTLPILPGIMPVASAARLRSATSLAAEPVPADLLALLESAATPEEAFERGADHAAALARAVLDGGAPGLHLYTFNRHELPLAVLDRLGLAAGAASPAAGSDPAAASPADSGAASPAAGSDPAAAVPGDPATASPDRPTIIQETP
ncbi:methylenetetrahydrofolate reductase [Curtobacterium ammoniigenes]|uniref:methylenetetrahydrofolate reductase n=1 Tax=Curtobacterium ammoniigenes TaxID=395387 RepID=UPI0009F9A08C|nr:methylenetetrahydrofolate reductase [Curtobacterium ammoniigenes]